MDAQTIGVIVVAFAFGITATAFWRGRHAIKLDLPNGTILLTPTQAEPLLQALYSEAMKSVEGLDEIDRKLFRAIESSGGRANVDEIVKEVFNVGKVSKFTRNTPDGSPSEPLQRLRKLRDRKLIRPAEGGKFESDKLLVVTDYAKMLLRVQPNAI